MDDGCDLVSLLHSERPAQVKDVLAGTEETTTGVIRLKAMAADGALGFPVVAVNEALRPSTSSTTGTAPASRTVDGILRATNILLAGRNVVIAGYGWVGRGIASRMHGMGAHVAIIEVDPVRALEALMDGLPGDDRRRRRAVGRAVRHRDRATSTSSAASTSRRCRTARSWRTPATSTPSWTSRRSAQMAEGHVRDARENVQEFDLGRQEGQPHRRGPAGQPRRGRGPPGGGHGHELREPGALGGVRRRSTTPS